MTDWVKFLHLNPTNYNCFTFIEEVYPNAKIWDSAKANAIYNRRKHRWGEELTFSELDKSALSNKNIVKVDITDLKIYDVLVFGFNQDRPFHCGLYIGKNQFIHLRKIPKIDDLTDEWRSKLKKIYRAVNNDNGNTVT